MNRRRRVFIIEDDPDIVIILSDMLKELNYEVAGGAIKGETALESIQESKEDIDIILMDINLQGGLDGIQTAAEIEQHTDIPIVYLTGASDTLTFQRAIETTPYGYLIKPIHMGQLHITLEIALQKYQLERDLRSQQLLLSLTLNNIADGVLTCSSDQNITFINPAAKQLIGLSNSNSKPYQLSEILTIVDENNTESQLDAILQEISGQEAVYHNQDLVLQTLADQYIPLELTASGIFNEGVFSGTVFVLRNISQRKEKEQQTRKYQDHLRMLTTKSHLIEEKERRNIANTLQDKIGQSLAMSKMELQNVLLSSSLNQETADGLQIVHETIEESIDEIRNLTQEISPPVLYELGFESGLSWLLERVSKESHIETELILEQTKIDISHDTKIILFRAVNELLKNVIKHAEATTIEMQITYSDNFFTISIADNGQGFNSSSQEWVDSPMKGFGLFNIRERLQQIGGNFEIYSTIGKGTTALLHIPFESNR